MILMSSDRTIWKASDQIKDINIKFYNALGGIPLLKIQKYPRSLRVLIDDGEGDASEVILEGLL